MAVRACRRCGGIWFSRVSLARDAEDGVPYTGLDVRGSQSETPSRRFLQRALMKNTFTRIYDIVRQIPPGRVSTYGQIALLSGNPRFSAVVGYALNGCPADSDVPTHRVVNRFGGMADAFLPLGKETHRMLLEMEGVEFTPDGFVDLDRFMWWGPEA